jgi:Cytochrome c554 and c-prime
MKSRDQISDSFRVKTGNKLRAGGGILLLACVALAPIVLSQALGAPVSTPDQPQPNAYAGDAACAQCHRKQAVTYAFTPHARDSAPASAGHILGSFLPGRDLLHTSDPNLVIKMTSSPDGFYQNAVNLSDPQNHLSERFDIAIGSGRHGQSYLYWNDDQLYELPASYWAPDHSWIISPGFPDGQVHFDRPVEPRCLECHTSYFSWIAPDPNRFAKTGIVYGINCERCHGPGADHVARERAAVSRQGSRLAPADLAIVNPAHLSRERQLDLCSLCHAGAVDSRRPPMTFQAGDYLEDYLAVQPAAPGDAVDVHGNQVGALELSKCFNSSNMTCSTCHDVHERPASTESYSHHCLTCHQMQTCGKYPVLGQAIRTKCVSCHMPLGESDKIVSNTGGHTLRMLARSHQIAIYPTVSARIERSLAEK